MIDSAGSGTTPALSAATQTREPSRTTPTLLRDARCQPSGRGVSGAGFRGPSVQLEQVASWGVQPVGTAQLKTLGLDGSSPSQALRVTSE